MFHIPPINENTIIRAHTIGFIMMPVRKYDEWNNCRFIRVRQYMSSIYDTIASSREQKQMTQISVVFEGAFTTKIDLSAVDPTELL